VATDLQAQISTIESRITSIDAKVKQIIGLQKQFGVNLPIVETSSSSTDQPPDELLIRVKEKKSC